MPNSFPALRPSPGQPVTRFHLTVTPAGAVVTPEALSAIDDWVPATAPGTAAAALAAAGRYDPLAPESLHDKDIWYRADLVSFGEGAKVLSLEGLATIAEVYLDGTLILSSGSMFEGHELPVHLKAQSRLDICFRALAPYLEAKGPRARWRPQLAASQGLRLVRTTLLGHMPGWCPEIHAVGPWRAITLHEAGQPTLSQLELLANLGRDGVGYLTFSGLLEGWMGEVSLVCGGQRLTLEKSEEGRWAGTLEIPDVRHWMPHTHGTPHLYEVQLYLGSCQIDLGRTGFRRIEVETGADGKGFGLTINDVSVFCRGAVWTNADLLGLSGDSGTYRPLLEKARLAGMNMLRIGGTMVYETRAFFELCDELGILVWQDFQFANYDYPVQDEAFAALVQEEARQQLTRLQECPSLAVLCGGSEIYQQGAMMGLPESRWKGALCEELLRVAAGAYRPDVPYVANSPCGGALPFSPNEGVAHYYGVGAYLRPLEDARRAEVRFAAECLAFSNVPESRTLEKHLPVKPGHDPRWKARIPRDRGAGWDFEDVRDHYLKSLYGVDPLVLRYGDPDRYLDLSRAVTADILEQTFGEWRRAQSTCRGALVWTFQDLLPGAGWGVIDATGCPKPAWHALRRAFRPLNVTLSDEGTNGLFAHLHNETPAVRQLVLTVSCLRDGMTPVVSGKRAFELGPHSSQDVAATDLFGAFFDTAYAYRFGPPAHDVTVARLVDEATGEILSEAFHFPQGFDPARQPLDIQADLAKGEDADWLLTLTAARTARFVHLDVEGFLPLDNWFHIAPGAPKLIRLVPETESDGAPAGILRAVSSNSQISFRG
ncbi:glycoside hydrolase family 2 protein [Roseibium litorale]|uniref:Glycoside hydrolase family 2 protein n=1 Tax=Roseibium litorale TaxID=2803841 RepID=A0ABR9CNH5_9HYPH|nr:glycoside hydrolase family 2 protein [Roseibium litorale]MBD8892429.1 glycoside hydrolase family 2 protein [Roseibium litorale]